MKELERLFSSDPDLARLHDVLDRDAPPDGAIERATARVLADDVSQSASSNAKAARPGPSFAPWVLVGGATVVIAGALAWWSPSRPESRTDEVPIASPRAIETVEPIASAAEEASSRGNARPTTPSVRVDELPTASPASPASRHVAAQPPAGSADPFLEELALVERARAALAQGRGRECLEATRGYETRFASRGSFREEVEVMHIEALAMSGERSAARARGQRFLAAHPDTPYVERIRRVLDQVAE